MKSTEWDLHERRYCNRCSFKRRCPVVGVMRVQPNDQTVNSILRDGKCTQFKYQEKKR